MIDVVLPVLNEFEALPWVLERMPQGFRPIVADNGSTDGSVDLARSLGVDVVLEPRRGFGAASYAGLEAAVSEIVCFMDCDGSLDPRELPELTRLIEQGADLALGARCAKPGAWPLHARLSNRVLAFEVRRRTGIQLTDIGPMRASRRLALLALHLEDRGFGWPLEMILQAARAGWHIAEVPVAYAPRTGKSKVTGTVRGTARAVMDMAKVLR